MKSKNNFKFNTVLVRYSYAENVPDCKDLVDVVLYYVNPFLIVFDI